MNRTASAMWLGIIKARPLLVKGMRVRVGNGYLTEMWDTRWVPDDGQSKLSTPRPLSTFYPMRVEDLIDPVTCTWNKQMIEENFKHIDCERILAIPVGAITSSDRLVWHYAKDGNYSVRSAYQVSFATRSSEGRTELSASSGKHGVKLS